MTDPVDFTLLNLDSNSKLEFEDVIMPERGIMTFAFDLSQEINVEKRQVTSIPGLFGDLGGLYEFLATIAAALVSGYQVRAYSFDLIKSFFRVAGLKRQ